MEEYYTGGYYLVKLSPIENGEDIGKVIYTCDSCFNTLAYNYWALSWVNVGIEDENPKKLGLDKDILKEIYKWTDEKLENEEIEVGSVLPDYKLANEFKNMFYQNRNDIEVLRIDFSKTEAERLIEDFAPGANPEINRNDGRIQQRHSLLKKKKDSIDKFDFVGYDIIGISMDGSYNSYNSFDILDRLFDKFD